MAPIHLLGRIEDTKSIRAEVMEITLSLKLSNLSIAKEKMITNIRRSAYGPDGTRDNKESLIESSTVPHGIDTAIITAMSSAPSASPKSFLTASIGCTRNY